MKANAYNSRNLLPDKPARASSPRPKTDYHRPPVSCPISWHDTREQLKVRFAARLLRNFQIVLHQMAASPRNASGTEQETALGSVYPRETLQPRLAAWGPLAGKSPKRRETVPGQAGMRQDETWKDHDRSFGLLRSRPEPPHADPARSAFSRDC